MCRCDDPSAVRPQVAGDEPVPLPRPAVAEQHRGPVMRGHRYAPLPSGVSEDPSPFYAGGRYYANAFDAERQRIDLARIQANHRARIERIAGD